MDFDAVIEGIKDKAEERKRKNPEIEVELRRLSALPLPNSPPNSGQAESRIEAELHLANLSYNPCTIPPGARWQFIKKAVFRVSRLFMHGQVQFNAASVRVLNGMHGWLNRLSADQELHSRSIKSLQECLSTLQSEQRDLLKLLQLIQVEGIEGIRESAPLESNTEVARKDLLGLGQFPNSLGFLERFRGTEEAVAEQQRQYLEYFRHCEPVLDLGCGRGEFLTLLLDGGIKAQGVEMDPILARYLKDRKLPVIEAGMFEALAGMDNESIGGVFVAQVIEHFEWRHVVELLQLIHAKLSAGGVLLVESLNPSCLNIFAEAMYLDPTHVRPYHPAGIAYLCENLGFPDTEVKFSAPVDESLELGHYSKFRHYAVIARK